MDKDMALADVAGIIGGILCLVAGVYLFTSRTQDANSYLMTIAHGIGIYFVGKGLFVIQSVVRGSGQVSFLSKIHGDLSLPKPPVG